MPGFHLSLVAQGCCEDCTLVVTLKIQILICNDVSFQQVEVEICLNMTDIDRYFRDFFFVLGGFLHFLRFHFVDSSGLPHLDRVDCRDRIHSLLFATHPTGQLPDASLASLGGEVSNFSMGRSA